MNEPTRRSRVGPSLWRWFVADAFAQNRIKLTLTLLIDVERDWMQRTIEVTGADEDSLIGLVVKHPEPFRDLSPSLARTLLECVDAIRAATATTPYPTR